MEGTNNEAEAYRSFKDSGINPTYVHIHDLETSKVDLEDYQAIFIPGGFSAGDYVRAGAIFAIRLKVSSGKKISKIIENGVPVFGTCNGFQVLSEMGLTSSDSKKRDIALDVNQSGKFECRIVYIKYTGKNKIFDGEIPRNEIFEIPVAHKEGRIRFLNTNIEDEFVFRGGNLFTYVDREGNEVGYPWNPNGSPKNIAGLSGSFDNVFGLMPHPERMFYDYQLSTQSRIRGKIPFGKLFFSSIAHYIRKI
jgi:phosphoribosylformylglycinamidine synthase